MIASLVDLSPLVSLIKNQKTLILTGAGISTESGIPDYRGPETIKKTRNPIRYQQFVSSHQARQRYWARSLVGWPVMAKAKPNKGHEVLAKLEARANVTGILTQNVDGLHQQAGSQEVLELHGGLNRVICLSCGWLEPRERLQRRLLHLNPEFDAVLSDVAPDGDAELEQTLIEDFKLAPCLRCGGLLKPDVVFFGENVPKERLDKAWALFEEADVLMVLGSSLTVFSGYRFAVRAKAEKKPLIIVNQGETRADDLASLKLERPLGTFLSDLDAIISAN